MPFIKKIELKDVQHSTDPHRNFIGRTVELHFFVEHILKPENPTHNIISIWGQGGVGKSALLSRFISEAHSPKFRGYCLTALVDERQTTIVSMMEKFADQLQMTGGFPKALARYKEALRKPLAEHTTRREALLRKAPDLISSITPNVPIVGGILKDEVKSATEFFLNEHRTHQHLKDAERLEDPINDLTKAFVEELNLLADTQIIPSFDRKLRGMRIILFFDTFEQLASEAAPWLLNHFLAANISNNVVLIIAGRDPIERSTPDDPKQWLPFFDDATIGLIPLDSFTEDETSEYLIARGITEPPKITTVWQLSQGLPLYLSLLTSNPQGKFDPTKDVVINFLRWIPEQEKVKRQLTLDIALLSTAFTQDDLEAFTYLEEHQRLNLYQWLIGLPFVQTNAHNGRYHYHDLVQALFNRHLYQRSRKDYYATRRALADHYRRLLENIQAQGVITIPNSAVEGKPVYYTFEWLELVLEVVYQLFFLSDATSHREAIELVLKAYEYSEQIEEIVRILRKLSREQFSNQISPSTQHTLKLLIRYIEADWPNIRSGWAKHKRAFVQELQAATDTLLQTLVNEPSFSRELLACIYRKRGFAYRSLKEYQSAIVEYNRAIEMNPNYARAYASRGSAYRLIKEYKQAIKDYDHALELEPNYAWAYTGRGETYRLCKEYNKAIVDLSRAIELEPNYAWAYHQRGVACREINDLLSAVADFSRALELTPKDSRIYSQRGFTYLLMNIYQQSLADFDHAFELDPKDINAAWMSEWCKVCQERPHPNTAELLEKIALADSEHYLAYVCRGIALWLRNHKDPDEVLIELEHAILLEPGRWDAYFWKGLVCAYLGRGGEALAALESALMLNLPLGLLAPLRWLEQDRPDFYEQNILPLLASHQSPSNLFPS